MGEEQDARAEGESSTGYSRLESEEGGGVMSAYWTFLAVFSCVLAALAVWHLVSTVIRMRQDTREMEALSRTLAELRRK